MKFTAEDAERTEIKDINHKGHEGPQRNTHQSRMLEIDMMSFRDPKNVALLLSNNFEVRI